ncbi:Heat shock protein 15 [Serratia liquefaciens]|nr:Heat shock protein 15 [Serratia liquefaciens]
MKEKPTETVRLDKWLWAARFYKTRALAREMIEGGKVHYNGQRSKPGKIVELDAMLTLRQGNDERTVRIIGITEQRRPQAKPSTCMKRRWRVSRSVKKWPWRAK